MINLPLKIPIINLQLSAVERRLLANHPMLPQITSDLAKREAGFAGEKALDYYLAPLPYNEFHIFYGLRLINQYSFQIDVLLLTMYLAIIIESKSINGDILYDDKSNQFIVDKNGIKEGYKDPIAQAERQKIELTHWFKKNNFPDIPIEYLVSIKDPATKIAVNPGGEHILEVMIHHDHVTKMIKGLQKKHRKQVLSPAQLQSVGTKLVRSHTPLVENILEKYNMKESDIITGVQCPQCNQYAMKRINRKWKCPRCHAESTDAHKQSIHDYLLLMNPTITNSECRRFLHIKDVNVASRILRKSNLPLTGVNKGRVYHRPGIWVN